MKKILTILLVLPCFLGAQQNKYFSNAGSDITGTGTMLSPYASTTKANTTFASLSPGDSLLFKSGDTFYGSILVSKSGTSGSPIVISSYGAGAKPVITGFTNASGWTSLGGNKWQCSVPAATKPNILTINGTAIAMGRYPNTTYLPIQSFVANLSVTSSALSTAPNFTGGEVVIRKFHWSISRDSITSHAGSTINYTGAAGGYNSQVGFGFIIQNHVNTLDLQNEWAFNNVTKVLTVFSATSPTNVKISTVDKVINTDRWNYITVNNLDIQGGNVAGVYSYNAGYAVTGIKIKNCNISFCSEGIFQGNSASTLVDGCTVKYSANNGINISSTGGVSNNAVITNNTVSNSGMATGMGYFGKTQYCGLTVYGSSALIQYNRVDSSGYNGIEFFYNNSKVKNNLVDNFCSVKDDGAGIYTFAGGLPGGYTGREVLDNIILNGIGAGAGTDAPTAKGAHGIYIDDGSSNVLILRNSIANMGNTGIYIHNSQNLDVRDNTIYNAVSQLLVVHDVYLQTMPVRNVIMTNNLFFANTSTQMFTVIRTRDSYIAGIFSSINNNRYARPKLISTASIKTTSGYGISNKDSNYTVPSWTVRYPPYDPGSTEMGSNTNITSFIYNFSPQVVTTTFTGLSYLDSYGTIYDNLATLQPYSAKILIANGTVAAPNKYPVAATSPTSQTVTLPVNSATLNGSGSDSDGVIFSFGWQQLDGPGASTISPAFSTTTGVTTVSGLTEGIYHFELTVTDNIGATNSSITTVTVLPAVVVNTPPTSEAGVDAVVVLPGSGYTLVGSSTPGNTPVTLHEWSLLLAPPGGGGAIADPASYTTAVSGLVEGQYIYKLTVTDANGLVATDLMQIVVRPGSTKRRTLLRSTKIP